MTSLALSFNDVNFKPVQQNGQIWLTATELAKALGYAKSDAVTQVYERNKDEFTSSMTLTLKLRVKGFGNGNSEKEARIFSLRGAHLIAMFAKTSIAKQFRKWVLDILDREVLNVQIEQRQTISPEQQALLHEIVARRSQGERKIFAEMWSRHNRHFKIPRYAELLNIHFAEAIHYLETLDIKAKPETGLNTAYINNAQGLAIHMLWLSYWWKNFGGAIKTLSPNGAASINDHFTDGAVFALCFLEKEKVIAIKEKAEILPWHLNYYDRQNLIKLP